jgi:hypothetical protein
MVPKVVESLIVAEEDEIDQHFPITRIPIGSKDYLGMRLRISDGIITIDQTVYIDILVKAFKHSDSHPVLLPCDDSALSLYPAKDDSELLDLETYPYMSLVGGLLWLAGRSRPDIGYIVGVLCRASARPTLAHWQAASRVVKYLKGTRQLALTFSKDGPATLFRGSHAHDYNSKELVLGFTDSDYAGDKVTRRSTSAYAFLRHGLIAWSSKLQDLVTLSSMEAELVSSCNATKYTAYLKQLMRELGIEDFEVPTPMFGDNQSSIAWANRDDMVSKRSKHIDVRYHYTRDAIQNGLITFSYVNTNNNVADILTKPLPHETLVKFREALGLRLLE